MHAWLDCQVYIAVGFLLSAAAALRVDSCTIGGMDRAKYDEILGLDGTPYRSVVGWLWATAPRMTLMPARPRCAFPPER